jgi:pyridoxal phosphate enzyme (YggS family)
MALKQQPGNTNSLAERLRQVRAKIEKAALACQRNPTDITLLAVSKNHDIEQLRQAITAGCRHFGESYVQEAVAKIEQLAGHELTWHFIGPIQSNKTQLIARHFQWVHSVERDKIARRIHEQRPPGLAPLNVCIQVNLSGETTKSGIAVEDVGPLAMQIRQYANLRLRGLMTIGRKASGEAELRRTFAQLRHLLLELNSMGMSLDTLSMGMSGDMEAAICEGATIVRVGSAIFGPRQYPSRQNPVINPQGDYEKQRH